MCKQKEKDLKKEIDEFKKSEGEKKEQLLRDNMKKMKKAQIILYAILGLHDKAVKLALECDDFEMAKVYADKP